MKLKKTFTKHETNEYVWQTINGTGRPPRASSARNREREVLAATMVTSPQTQHHLQGVVARHSRGVTEV